MLVVFSVLASLVFGFAGVCSVYSFVRDWKENKARVARLLAEYNQQRD